MPVTYRQRQKQPAPDTSEQALGARTVLRDNNGRLPRYDMINDKMSSQSHGPREQESSVPLRLLGTKSLPRVAAGCHASCALVGPLGAVVRRAERGEGRIRGAGRRMPKIAGHFRTNPSCMPLCVSFASASAPRGCAQHCGVLQKTSVPNIAYGRTRLTDYTKLFFGGLIAF